MVFCEMLIVTCAGMYYSVNFGVLWYVLFDMRCDVIFC